MGQPASREDGPAEETVEVTCITIRKVFDDAADGGTAIYAEWSDGLGMADALGMLAFTEHMLVRDFLGDDDA